MHGLDNCSHCVPLHRHLQTPLVQGFGVVDVVVVVGIDGSRVVVGVSSGVGLPQAVKVSSQQSYPGSDGTSHKHGLLSVPVTHLKSISTQ